MQGVNKSIVVGNLGTNPERKEMCDGRVRVRFKVATNERWKDKLTGKPEERTEWHRIVVWGKLAEECFRFLEIGKQVYIEGKLRTHSVKTKYPDITLQITEIIGESVQFLGDKRKLSSGSVEPREQEDFSSTWQQ